MRPEEPRAGPSPARIPVTETLTGAPAPRIDSSEPRSRPSVAASRSVTSAPASPVLGQRRAADEDEVADAGLPGRVDAEDGDRLA